MRQAIAFDLVGATWQRHYPPPPTLTVSAWCDAYRHLPQGAGAEPGPWRTSRVPYMRAIMDALSVHAPYEVVVFAKGSQIGATESALGWLGYVMAQEPDTILAVWPTVELAKRNSKQRIDPLVEDTPTLKGLVRDARTRDSGNTVLHKEFPGGALAITGANSAVGMRSTSARYLYLDEVDGFEANAEGDPVTLARRATRNYGRRKKEYLTSTPVHAGLSRIEHELATCDVTQHYHVPCPSCGHCQHLVWEQVRWTASDPASARYQCAGCEQLLAEHHKTAMLAAGAWIDDAPRPAVVRSLGFHLNALYSPLGWYSWTDAVRDYERAKADDEKLRPWTNTVLGLGYAAKSDGPDWRRLYERREAYPVGVVPPGVRFLTAGVDVQPIAKRIEIEVVGWGRGKTSWSVTYLVLDVDVADARATDAALDAVLATDWPCAGGGTLPIRVLAIDCGAGSEHVYRWARRHRAPAWGPAGGAAPAPRSVMCVKGEDRWVRLVDSARAVDGKRGLRVFTVGVSLAKRELYGWLRLERPTPAERAAGHHEAPGYVHVPEYDERWFQGLVAERLVTRMKRGFPTHVWEKESSVPNEPLDARVYARAAAALYGLDRFTEAQWRALDRAVPPGLRGEQVTAPPSTPDDGRNIPDESLTANPPPAPVVVPAPTSFAVARPRRGLRFRF